SRSVRPQFRLHGAGFAPGRPARGPDRSAGREARAGAVRVGRGRQDADRRRVRAPLPPALPDSLVPAGGGAGVDVAGLRGARTGRMETETAARKLAQALGDLPLALEQAAALIQHARLSFTDYMRQFEAHWAELLAQKRPGGDYPDSVAMAWELSFRRVEAENPS